VVSRDQVCWPMSVSRPRFRWQMPVDRMTSATQPEASQVINF
jgi:hypothetical protein